MEERDKQSTKRLTCIHMRTASMKANFALPFRRLFLYKHKLVKWNILTTLGHLKTSKVKGLSSVFSIKMKL